MDEIAGGVPARGRAGARHMPGRVPLVVAGCMLALAVVFGVFGPPLRQERRSDAVRTTPQPGDAAGVVTGCAGAGAAGGAATRSMARHGDARAAQRRVSAKGGRTHEAAAGTRDSLRCGTFGTTAR